MAYPDAAWERAMTVQDVMLKALSGEIHWFRAAEILGVTARTMRRWREQFERHGCHALFDRRQQMPRGTATHRWVNDSNFRVARNLIYHGAVTTDPAALLRERGIQVTAQRLAVLRAVAGRPHVTADEVAEVVRVEIGAISLQSVYDALDVLVATGLIRRIQPARSPARFEDRVGDNHHHLICRVCGRMVDVECAVGSAPCLTAVDDRGYAIDEAEVTYWGRCPDCVPQTRTSFHPDTPARQRRGRRKIVRKKGPTISSPGRTKHPPD